MNEHQTKTIGELATHIGSGVTPTGGSEVYRSDGVIFIRSQNVHFGGLRLEDVAFLDERTHRRMRRSEINPHDVLLNITGASIGRCCPVPDELGAANVNQHVCAIRLPKPRREDAVFLSAVLESPIGQEQIERLNAGGNREGLNYQQVRNFVIPWPSEDQRTKVASVLDTAETAIREVEAVIAKLQQMNTGLIHDLLTRGLDGQDRLRDPQRHPERFRKSPFGLIPQEWDVVPVDAVGEVRLGRQRSPHHQTGRYTTPYLRVANVFDCWIDYSDVLGMDFTPAERGIYSLKPGDILLNEGQSLELVGRSAIYEGHSMYPVLCFQNTLVRFRSYEGNQPEFCQTVFKHWLDTGRFTLIARQTTSVAHLGADRFAAMAYPRPSPDEQRRIILQLRACSERLSTEKECRSKLELQKRGLMHDLLMGRVRL